jgi:iron complex outermembrane recepter protein
MLKHFSILLFLFSAPLLAQDDTLDLDMSFEELMNVKVISFDGTPKKWKNTPAAIHVITKDAIAKSAARSIPELLRGVPGIHVAQINANTWAVGSRGFTRRYSNKLLVLIDGRSIYTPVFSGVHWELNDIPLENIERIEVIRGPGASLWGANAVTGVINIITKSALDTQGNYLKLGGGSVNDAFGTYTFGDFLPDENLAYRLTISGNKTGHFKTTDGDNSKDDWQQMRLSTRIDWQPDVNNKIFFSGGTYQQKSESEINLAIPFGVEQLYEDDLDSYGSHLLTRWEHQVNAKNTLMAQFYYDIYKKESPGRSEEASTYDLEIRNVYDYNETHTFTLGTGYRIAKDDIVNADFFSYTPDHSQRDTFRIFGQDEITLLPDTLKLILGLKYERNDHTGTEWQPSAKLIWTASTAHTFWGSISRSVRTPSRGDEDLNNTVAYAGPTQKIVVVGDRGLESERQIAYELGYRFTPENSPFSLDSTLFYNDYNHFYDSTAIGTDIVLNDQSEGYTAGGELLATYTVNSSWSLQGSYSYIDEKISGDSVFAGGSPKNLASLQSELKMTEKVSLLQNFYYTDHYSSARNTYASQLKMDLGMTWKIRPNMNITAWGVNLLDPQTAEYADNENPAAESPRAFYIQLEMSF